jgi:hypothetical protein
MSLFDETVHHHSPTGDQACQTDLLCDLNTLVLSIFNIHTTMLQGKAVISESGPLSMLELERQPPSSHTSKFGCVRWEELVDKAEE